MNVDVRQTSKGQRRRFQSRCTVNRLEGKYLFLYVRYTVLDV